MQAQPKSLQFECQLHFFINLWSIPPPPPPFTSRLTRLHCNKLIDIYPPRAIIDSGASDHFVHSSYNGNNPQSKQRGLPVQHANMIMRSTGTDLLSLPRLPTNAWGCHKFGEVTTSLFSIGKLCDSGLHVTFSDTNVVVTDTAPVITGTVVMEGWRDGGVYSTPMFQPETLPRVPTNPLLSAYTQLHGGFDFNRTPIAPIGCKVIVHDRQNERGSWDNHGSPGYYIDRAEQHYRNYKCYMKNTKSTRISNTVEFFPTYCTLPRVRSIDRLTLVLQDLHEVLSQLPQTIPFLQQGTDLSAALQAIQKILCIVKDDTAPLKPTKRATRSTTAATLVYINGTIIRQRFRDGIHEGEIKQYDPKEKHYKVLYKDGDTEEMTHSEIKQYCKRSQRYSPAHETALLSSHVINKIESISTNTDQPSPFSNGYDKGVQMVLYKGVLRY
jgi:hypothetical protein